MNKAPYRLLPVAKLLAHCGKPGAWALRKLGWRCFLSKTFKRAHLESCTSVDVEKTLRPQGWVGKCKTCHVPVGLHFACWETPAGTMPGEVTRWLVEELSELAKLTSAENQSSPFTTIPELRSAVKRWNESEDMYLHTIQLTRADLDRLISTAECCLYFTEDSAAWATCDVCNGGGKGCLSCMGLGLVPNPGFAPDL